MVHIWYTKSYLINKWTKYDSKKKNYKTRRAKVRETRRDD